MKRPHSNVASVALASVSALALSAGAPAHAQAVNWAGSYIGANAGWAWGHSDVVTTAPCNLTIGTGYFCDLGGGFANGAAVAAAGTGSLSDSGFTGGVQAGHNWQNGNTVFGLEADFGAFDITASRSVSAPYPVTYNIVSTANVFTVGTTVDAHWLFTARGRVGWTFQNMLAYVTGGLALTQLHVSHSFIDTNSPPFAMGGSSSSTKVGWALGGGVEWMLNKNWSAKAEYLYVDFGSVTVNSAGTATSQGNGYSQAINTSADLTAHIARAGINYRF